MSFVASFNFKIVYLKHLIMLSHFTKECVFHSSYTDLSKIDKFQIFLQLKFNSLSMGTPETCESQLLADSSSYLCDDLVLSL